MKPKIINAIATNGKVTMSREDFLLLTKLAGANVETIESIRAATPPRKGYEPGTVVKKKTGPKKKGGEKV